MNYQNLKKIEPLHRSKKLFLRTLPEKIKNKMKRTGNKIIEFVVMNKFYETEVLKITMPYNPYKSLFGYYSRLWKNIKKVMSTTENVQQNHIRLRQVIRAGKTDRMIFEFESGVILDMPHDSTKYDFEIVIAQLNVIGMRFKKDAQP